MKIRILDDKISHFWAGWAIAAVAFTITMDSVLAIYWAGGIGLAKEIWDFFHRDEHSPEIPDALATLFGGLCFCLAIAWIRTL